MTSRLHNVTVDCVDPLAQATFWAAVTGYAQDPEVTGDDALLLPPGDGPGILFQRVPEGSCYRPVARLIRYVDSPELLDG